MRRINPSGNVYYDTEEELCSELEKYYLKHFYGFKWNPVEYYTKEVWISAGDRIDYCGIRLNKETFIEVKNWFVTQKDMEQILRYKKILEEAPLYVICGGIDKNRRKKLEDKNIIVFLTKEIVELDKESVVHWM